MIPRNVKSMTSTVRMHSKKEWVEEAACTIHLIYSPHSLAGAHLEVSNVGRVLVFKLPIVFLTDLLCLFNQVVVAVEEEGKEGEKM